MKRRAVLCFQTSQIIVANINHSSKWVARLPFLSKFCASFLLPSQLSSNIYCLVTTYYCLFTTSCHSPSASYLFTLTLLALTLLCLLLPCLYDSQNPVWRNATNPPNRYGSGWIRAVEVCAWNCQNVRFYRWYYYTRLTASFTEQTG